MPKARLRYRPLSALPLRERVVFRALAADTAENLAELDEYRDTRTTFEADLLGDDKLTHFAIADVASFYRYVSHPLLTQRIVEATGRADLAQAVADFLALTMRAGLGLPQNVGPSDNFADLLIAPIERRMVRRGFVTGRYNDDFRIGTTSNRSAREALEILHTELHALGLTLNESKTVILRRDTFEAHVEEVVGAEYGEGDELTAEPVTPQAIGGAVRSLRQALMVGQPRQKRSRLDESKAVDRVRRALRRLTAWGSPNALSDGRAIINRHPSLTQNYARYCARISEEGHGEDVASYLEEEFPKLILTPWQELWLLEPFAQSELPLGPNLAEWIKGRLRDSDAPPLLRARAALAAAVAHEASAEELLRLIDITPPVSRPDLIAAYAVATDLDHDAKEALGGLPDAQLAGWVFDDAGRFL